MEITPERLTELRAELQKKRDSDAFMRVVSTVIVKTEDYIALLDALTAARERITDLEAEAGIHTAFEPNGCPVCYDKGFTAAQAELTAARGALKREMCAWHRGIPPATTTRPLNEDCANVMGEGISLAWTTANRERCRRIRAALAAGKGNLAAVRDAQAPNEDRPKCPVCFSPNPCTSSVCEHPYWAASKGAGKGE